MNKIASKLLSIFFICFIFFTSCEKYPIDALLGLHESIGAWPDVWYVYDDEFNTKGNPEPYVWKDDTCDSWNNAKLTADCTDNPQSGTKCIKFKWGGNSNNNPNNSGKKYFGFGMQSRNEMGGTIDLTNSGYKYVKFYVRGTLCENCYFNIEIPNTMYGTVLSSSEITSNWEEHYFPLEEAYYYDLKNLKYVIALSLKTDGGVTNGGEVYRDNIRFVKDY